MRAQNGDPEKYCKANFLGRGEINEATLKDLLANSFCCVVCFDEGEGVPSRNFCEAKHRLHIVQLHLRYSATSFALRQVMLQKICTDAFGTGACKKQSCYYLM